MILKVCHQVLHVASTHWEGQEDIAKYSPHAVHIFDHVK